MADYPLLNEASLVMIPGATKEGKVYSQVPTDGSGDFTFTRSTSATRVNEAGNIEKGYENLLYPSNDFSGWTNINSVLTPNQAGYDGSNDAWLLEATSTQGRRYKNISDTGVLTYSIYAKSGTADILRLRIDAATDMDLRVDLSDGSFVSGTLIDYNIEDAGNGWWRVSVTQNITSPLYIFVYSYDVGSIYIQDAQLNQGLVAYPYLETTTAPVYGGLQSDQPRLDYKDATCPSLLLEPSRTNTVAHSEYFNSSQYNKLNTTAIDDNAIISPEGVQNAAKVRASVTSTTALGFENTSITSQYKAFSIFAKAGEISEMLVFGIQVSQGVFFNLNDGSISGYYQGNSSDIDNAYSVDYGNGWYRYIIIWASNSRPRIFTSDNQQITFIQTAGNGFYVYGLQYEDATYPTSYIPTYGSAQTRAAETTTSTFNSSSTGTISVSLGKVSEDYFTVLGEIFGANATRNDIAIAYSPTALKVSLNGAIVVNATGTYDTSSLSSLQLGHDNGSDQLGGGVENLIMFNDFLTDTELNAITV